MKSIALTLLLLTCFAAQRVEAGSYGCSESDKALTNHNAQDPTRPGTIGGCGLGQFKNDQFNQQQQKLRNEQILMGPSRMHNMGHAVGVDSW
jgi:hypothetical protein